MNAHRFPNLARLGARVGMDTKELEATLKRADELLPASEANTDLDQSSQVSQSQPVPLVRPMSPAAPYPIMCWA